MKSQKMKCASNSRHYLVVGFLSLCVLCLVTTNKKTHAEDQSDVSISQSDASKFDQQYEPIQPQELQHKLLGAGNDSVQLYDLIRQADTQGQITLAYETLDKMKHDDPQNAVVLAAFCLASRMLAGDYSLPSEKHHDISASQENAYEIALAKAYKINPKLWLTYAVEGHRLLGSFEDMKVLHLLTTAVKLAPGISYTHTLLGSAYAIYGTPYHSFPQAEKEFLLAKNLKPISAYNADSLFDIYDLRMPNREKAKKAKQYLLSTLPPNFKINPIFQARLAKY